MPVPTGKIKFKGENDTAKAFRAIRSDINGLTSGIGKLGGVVAGVIGIGGMASFVSQTLQSADAIGKMSARIGIGTRELQEYQHAFSLAGVEQGATSQGLLIFEKRLGKARQGIGALAGGLKGGKEDLLQTVRATNSASEALDVIFAAMGRAKNAAERLAIADAAFGGAGLKMASAFEDGAESFNKARREASELGLVLSDDLINNAEQLNDQMARAGGIIKTQLAAAFLELAPAISKALDKFIEFSKLVKDFSIFGGDGVQGLSSGSTNKDIERAVEAEIDRMKRFINNLKNSKADIFGFELPISVDEAQLKEAQGGLEILEIILKNIQASAKAAGKQIDQSLGGGKSPVSLGIASRATLQGIDQLHPTDRKRFSRFKPVTLPQDPLLAEFKDFILSEREKRDQRVRQLLAAGETLVARGDISPEAFGAAKGRINDQFNPVDPKIAREQEKKLDAVRSAFDEGLTADERRLNQLFKSRQVLENITEGQMAKLGVTSADVAAAIGNIGDQIENLGETADPALSSILTGMDRIRSGIEGPMADALADFTKGFGNLGDTAASVLDLIHKEFIRLALVAPLLDGLFGKRDSKGNLSGGLLSGLVSGFSGLFGFASGGSFTVGGSGGIDSRLVAFRATPGERVTVQTPQQQNGGGPTINVMVHNNFALGVQPTVRAEIKSLIPKINESAKAAVLDAVQRGGTFGRAFA